MSQVLSAQEKITQFTAVQKMLARYSNSVFIPDIFTAEFYPQKNASLSKDRGMQLREIQ